MEKNIDDINFFYILKNALPISLNYYIDKIPFTMTFILLKILNQEKEQAILALTISYLNFSFAHLQNMESVIGIKCAKNYGKKNYQKFWDSFFIYTFINYLLFIQSFIAVYFSKEILIFLKVDFLIVDVISTLLKKIFILKLIENFSKILRGVLIAQKITHIFLYTNITNFIIFFSLNYITMINLNLSLNGFLIAFYAKTISEFLILIFLLKKNNKIKFYYPTKKIFKNFVKKLKFTINICFGRYGITMGIESQTYYTTLTKINKIQNINSWYFFFNIIAYVYYIAQGGLSLFRTYTSYYYGQGNRKKFERVWKKLFRIIFCYKYFFVLLLGFFAYDVAELFTNDQLTKDLVVFLLRVYMFISPVGLIYDFYSMLLNVMGYDKCVFRISTILFPCCMITFGYLFCIYFGFGVKGLGFSFLLSLTSYSVVVLVVFYSRIDGIYKRMEKGEMEKEKSKEIEIELIDKK